MIRQPKIHRDQADGGFTLIEVLVALLIVGLIGAIASMRGGISPVVAVEDESNRLRQTIESALDRSRLARTPVVWRASPKKYELTIREAGSERTIAHRELDAQITITSVLEGRFQCRSCLTNLFSRGGIRTCSEFSWAMARISTLNCGRHYWEGLNWYARVKLNEFMA